jgi:hypothetical protein
MGWSLAAGLAVTLASAAKRADLRRAAIIAGRAQNRG